jgi:hypothetical protein
MGFGKGCAGAAILCDCWGPGPEWEVGPGWDIGRGVLAEGTGWL